MENKKYRNRIITLSGEPVSGKGTTVKSLIKILKEQGYSDEQIHLMTTGDQFRKYFNSIVDLIINLDNLEELKEISSREELSAFFENKEYRKALTKTILKLKEDKVDLSKFTIEQANNSQEFKDIRKIVDSLLDEGVKKMGENINSEDHPNDVWIIDSRLAFFNIPESFSVRLTANPEVAAQRLFNDKSRGKEDSRYKTVEEAKIEREERKRGERERYLKRYGVDLENPNNYDLIIDTSDLTPEETAKQILNREREEKEESR